MRGKNGRKFIPPALWLGSPPLAREKLIEPGPLELQLGITPACAGKTVICICPPLVVEDHPRLRGKNRLAVSVLLIIKGSPPLAREKRQNTSDFRRNIRITPACAGKTFGSARWIICAGDHPRLRGKNSMSFTENASLSGSPPLAREKHIYIPYI